MNNIIFCPSPPQSGTWFALRLIEKCGYKIEHVGEILRRTENRIMDRKTPTVLHTHIFPFYYQGTAFKEAWPTFGGDPIKDYVVRRYTLSINAIELMASLYKTIIPIRDPLNCLLTREVRAPNYRHFYITDAYIELAKRFMDHPNVIFLPVDLYAENLYKKVENLVEKRVDCLTRILKHVGIDTEQYSNVITDLSTDWKRENMITTNRFREHYEKGDILKIKEMLGSKWAEVEHLKIHASTIFPLLIKAGYKEFIWQNPC